TTLSPHQVDALSGTLAALLAEAERNGQGSANGARPTPAPVLAVDDEPEDEDEDELTSDDEELEAGPSEPDDAWDDDEAPPDVDEDVAEGAADDPNAHKRFWFEHATGAGKTVAAMGFVEASRTGGVLILTHRRNLVDQFHGELRTRGYAKRESPPLLDGDGTRRVDGPVTVETYQW